MANCGSLCTLETGYYLNEKDKILPICGDGIQITPEVCDYNSTHWEENCCDNKCKVIKEGWVDNGVDGCSHLCCPESNTHCGDGV